MAPIGRRLKWDEVSGEFPSAMNASWAPDRIWLHPTKLDAERRARQVDPEGKRLRAWPVDVKAR